MVLNDIYSSRLVICAGVKLYDQHRIRERAEMAEDIDISSAKGAARYVPFRPNPSSNQTHHLSILSTTE